MNENKLVSLVIPVYNEEAVIQIFLDTVCPLVNKEPYNFEFIFVNDGSSDRTLETLLAANAYDERIKIVNLSRNFGKESALAAGFRAAAGEAAIPMDVDLQDPPELIGEFLRKWEEGHDVVLGVRRFRSSDTAFKRKSAELFYRLFNFICKSSLVPNAGDYRLMSRAALDVLNSMPERVRFTKGLYAWVGFKQAAVLYDRPARAAGYTKWSVWKLWNFALDGITGFSTFPLRIWSYIGMIVALIGFGYALLLIARTLLFGVDLPGYPSLMVTVLFLGGLILMSLGVIGEYLGRVYEETKARPLYVVQSYIGFSTLPEAVEPGICPCCGCPRPRKEA